MTIRQAVDGDQALVQRILFDIIGETYSLQSLITDTSVIFFDPDTEAIIRVNQEPVDSVWYVQHLQGHTNELVELLGPLTEELRQRSGDAALMRSLPLTGDLNVLMQAVFHPRNVVAFDGKSYFELRAGEVADKFRQAAPASGRP